MPVLIRDEEPVMTVGELIAELQKFDAALPVYHEGCDCDGSASDVTLEDGCDWIPGGKRVYIGRNR